jgi:hypothetical protein
VRVIEYSVTTRDEHGATASELFSLATTLLDVHTWPIEEFQAPYHHDGGQKRCWMRSRPPYAAARTS